jgi:Tfp pilus assembly protein PilN
MGATEASARKSRLHELKQAWRAAHQRWLKELREAVPGDVELDRLWEAYCKAGDAYVVAKAEGGGKT